MIATSMLDLVGSTPLVRIRGTWLDGAARPARGRASVWAKMEHLNPGGSVKDRIARAMIEDAEARGVLRPPGPVVEPTSGNTGIGLALVCSVKGYRLILTMPESMSLERRQLLESLRRRDRPDARRVADGGRHRRGAQDRRAHTRLVHAFAVRQPGQPLGPRAHERARDPRCDGRALDRRLRCCRRVRAARSAASVRSSRRFTLACASSRSSPSRRATISRGERGPTKIQGIGAGFVPPNYRASAVDEVRTVRDDDAWRTKLRLARREGLLVGPSAGANVFVAFELAAELGEGKNVVTVLCDTGERYFSLDEYFPGVTAEGNEQAGHA